MPSILLDINKKSVFYDVKSEYKWRKFRENFFFCKALYTSLQTIAIWMIIPVTFITSEQKVFIYLVITSSIIKSPASIYDILKILELY